MGVTLIVGVVVLSTLMVMIYLVSLLNVISAGFNGISVLLSLTQVKLRVQGTPAFWIELYKVCPKVIY